MRPETRERVLEAIEALNYTPVKAAQTLRRQRTKMLGIVIPDIANLYFALLTRGIESVAFNAGYTTLICDSDGNPEREKQYLDILLSEGVEGVLYVPVGKPDRGVLEKLQQQGIRIVAADRRLPGVPSVEVDNSSATRDLVEHILRLGYRRIAYIAGPEDVSTGRDRLAGFRDALLQSDLDAEAIEVGDFTFEAGHRLALRILDRGEVEAIITANDMMAFGALRAAEDRGRAVPRNLGVAGFDHVPHVPYATFMHAELTTVEVPIRDIGIRAAELLLEGAEDPIIMPTRLIRGGTCRPVERSSK
jgi:LacI family repressor for deo operon, udp, cdd, tsx, nupC, and nupG